MEGRGSREEGTSQLRVMTEQTQTNNRAENKTGKGYGAGRILMEVEVR